MTATNKIFDDLRQRILVLDGAFGTMLQTYDLGDACTASPKHKAGCNDLLSVTRPDIVADIHRRYLEAGADIISTNSFNANAISLADYGLQDRAYEIARAAAEVARKEADCYSTPGRRRYVAGSIGPTNRTLSMSADVTSPAARDVTFMHLYNAFSDQARGLIDGGADIILIETIFDTLNAKAAIAAVRDISADIPVMLSATVSDASGRILTGQTVEAFCASVAHAKPMSIGLNCGLGAKHLLPHLRHLAEVAQTHVSVHPNAGLPNVMGQYDETPEMFVTNLSEYLREGLVNIVGGCCGTTPEHIKALAAIAGNYPPRQLPLSDHICTLSGLEPLSITPEANFINIGERTNVAGSAKFARLIREGLYDEALAIARAQVEAGAQIVDVCMDDAMIDGVAAMGHFLNLMASDPEIARVPVMIDSSKWLIIETGLQTAQGKSIVNSISLKEGEEVFLDHARTIMRYGAAAVVMLFDEEGQADTYDRKVQVARRAYDLLMGIGFNPEDIIFDPNILAVATGIEAHDRYARDFIDATRWIKENLPYAKVSGGVSNLSFAFRGNNQVRKAMHAVFLYHAIAAGMDMAIVNPQMVQLYDDIEPELLERVEDVILYRRADASDRLAEHAKTLAETETKTAATVPDDAWRSQPYDRRITHAMLKGDVQYIADDTLEAYHALGSAVAVIDQVLMPAMASVGQLFAQGKMFLPQVVKSARVMKLAVSAIEPYFKSDSQDASAADKHPIVIATVKGDVHDIGKNIVAVVLSCNGYDVHDLGVMVPPERIISEAVRLDAAAICLSGLITPSLDEMIHVVEEAARQGLKTPIIVGGATTSALHTAVKIAPKGIGPVIHSTDAADNANIVANLLGAKRAEYLQGIANAQQRLRDDYARPQTKATVCPCCASIIRTDTSSAQSYEQLTELYPHISDIREKINWSFFFAGWGLPGTYPAIFDSPDKGDEARKLYDDAQRMLDLLSDRQAITIAGKVQTFDATADGDDLVLSLADGSTRRLPMLRGRSGQCVTDFIDGSEGRVTLFALTAGIGAAGICDEYRAAGDEYSAIMVKLLCDRLVEAFADTVLHGGCRIAIGYPSAPDHTLKRDIFDILHVQDSLPMSLTESYMISPGESICGIYLTHGHYINASDATDEQIAEYAHRRGLPLSLISKSFK